MIRTETRSAPTTLETSGRPLCWVTFHADTSSHDPRERFTLKAAGRAVELVAHDDASRARARAADPALVDVLDAQLGHYTAAPVPMPADAVTRVHFEHTLEHAPGDPRDRAVSLAAIFVPRPGVGETAETATAFHIDYVTLAQAVLFHHSDLMTNDPQLGSVVFEHMEQATAPDTYTLIENLATAMRDAGPPTLDGDTGWASLYPVEVPTTDEDGNPNYDDTKTSYMLQITEDIMTQAGPAMTSVQVSTKNDTRLENKKWTLQNGTSVTDVSQPAASSPPAPQPAPVSAATLASVRRPVADAEEAAAVDDDWTVALANTDKVDGLKSSVEVVDAASNQIQVTFENYYLRYLAGYVEFLDADGNVMSVPDWHPDDAFDWAQFVDLETDSLRFLGYMDPVLSISAIPVSSDPGTLTVKLTFPEGAVSANIYGCGLGIGDFEHPQAYVIGALFTGVANLAVPAILLGFGVAAQSYKGLYKAMSSKAVIGTIVLIGGAYYATSIGYTAVADHEVDWQSFSTIGTLAFSKGMTAVFVWMEEQIVEGEIEDAIPFAGWIMLAINIATGIAQMAETIVEVATSPWQIGNQISTTIESTVTVEPDPRAGNFPQPATGETATCTLKMIFKNNQPTISSTFDVPDGFDQTTIDFTLINQLGNGEVKFEADFYLDSWKAASASTGWLANNEENTAQVYLALVEQPVPLSSSSTYIHTSLLDYDSGNYAWVPTANPPTTTITSRDTGSSGNAISLWNGLTLSQRDAMLGYAWKAAGTGLSSCTDGTTGSQLNAFQNVDIPGMAMDAVKFPGCGFNGETRLLYDPYPPKFEMDNDGQWKLDANGNPIPDPSDVDLGAYYIDPRSSGESADQGGGYHLRNIVLDTSTPFDTSATQPSYGRFPYYPNSAMIHPSGHVIAVNSQYGKVMVLQLPSAPVADVDTPMARVYAGTAQNYNGSNGRAGLLANPLAVTCAYDGTILVLESIAEQAFDMARLQAFDMNGNPVSCFLDGNGDPTPFLPLPTGVTYLDIAAVGDQKTTYVWVLYYDGSGSDPSDYHLATYQYGTKAPAANPLVVTDGVPAANLAVDMWYTAYTLNFAMTTDTGGAPAGPVTPSTPADGRTVPSLSEWKPPVPTS